MEGLECPTKSNKNRTGRETPGVGAEVGREKMKMKSGTTETVRDTGNMERAVAERRSIPGGGTRTSMTDGERGDPTTVEEGIETDRDRMEEEVEVGIEGDLLNQPDRIKRDLTGMAVEDEMRTDPRMILGERGGRVETDRTKEEEDGRERDPLSQPGMIRRERDPTAVVVEDLRRMLEERGERGERGSRNLKENEVLLSLSRAGMFS